MNANGQPPHEDETASSPTSFKPDWRLKSIFGIVGILNFVAALDATALSTALPIIADDIQGTTIEAYWAGTSFLVSSAVFQPVFSALSDIFGRQPALLLGVGSFTLGSILAGVAKGFNLLLAGRSIQGIGGGGIIALTEVLLADLIPLQERGKWFSIRSGTWAFGTVLGPIIGGAFAQSVTWRWIFWINLPFCGVGMVLIPLFLKLDAVRTSTPVKIAQVDYIGCFLFISSLTSFLIPLTWGGIMYVWDSWHTLVPLILGVIGLACFTLYEMHVPCNPLIPREIFSNYSSTTNYLGCFMHGTILWCLLYYLPLYFQGVLGYSPIITGLALFPQTFTVAPISIIVGVLIAKTGSYRWALWSGWIISTLGMGLLYLLDTKSTAKTWILLVIPGIGLGILFPSVMLAVQASAIPEYISISATMTTFFRTLGQAVGVAIGGGIFQNQVEQNMHKYSDLGNTAESYAADAASLVQYIQSLPSHSTQASELIDVYADSLSIVWVVMCGLAGVTLVISLFVKRYPLSQAFNPKQGLRESSTSTTDCESNAAFPNTLSEK